MRVQAAEAVLIAFTYIGTVVGAGFASGREIDQFFLQSSPWLLGVVVAAGVFALLGVPLIRIGQGSDESVGAALRPSCGRALAGFTELVLGAALFGGLCIMIAGGGAAFDQAFGVPLWVGLLGMTAISWLTVRAGIAGLKVANALVVPALVGITGLVWYFVQAGPPAPPGPIAQGTPAGALGSAVLYALFNTALALPVILSLGASATHTKRATTGLLLGVATVALLVAAVGATLVASGPAAMARPIPMLFIAGRLHPWLHHLYFVALLGEIYTTAIGNLFGVAKSLEHRFKVGPGTAAGVACLAALAVSALGFSQLVETLYPAFGYAMGGLIVLAVARRLLLWSPLQ